MHVPWEETNTVKENYPKVRLEEYTVYYPHKRECNIFQKKSPSANTSVSGDSNTIPTDPCSACGSRRSSESSIYSDPTDV